MRPWCRIIKEEGWQILEGTYFFGFPGFVLISKLDHKN
jgi:hypothetical protein